MADFSINNKLMFSKKRLLKINLYLSFLLIAIGFGLGFIIPNLSSSLEENWTSVSNSIIDEYQQKVNLLVGEKITSFNSGIEELISELEKGEINNSITLSEENDLSFQLWIGDSLVCWNDFVQLDKGFLNKLSEGEVYFFGNEVKAYLVRVDKISINEAEGILVTEKLVEKFYRFDNDIYDHISLSDEISTELNVESKIEYNINSVPSKNGLMTSIPIVNLSGEKIGYAYLPHPSFDVKRKEENQRIQNIQSVIFFVALLIFIVGLFFEINNSIKLYKLFVSILSVIILRAAAFIFDIGKIIFPNQLNGPQYFSSSFLWGVVKSPGELILTLLAAASIIYFIVDLLREVKIEKILLNKFGILPGAILILISLLLIRSIAAIARSFVFDSTLRYFNLKSLFPTFPIVLNLILLVLITFSIIYLIYQLIYPLSKIKNNRILSIFLIGSVLYFLMDRSFLISPFLQLGLLIILLLNAKLSTEKWISGYTKLIILFLISSIFSIFYLNKFNDDLIKNSLKISAEEVVNAKENLYYFWLRQTLSDESNLSRIEKYEGKNWDAICLLTWNYSPFMKEDIPSWVAVYDSLGDILGGYEYLTYEKIPINLKGNYMGDEVIVSKYLNGSNNYYEGTVPVLSNGEKKYLLFGIEFGALTYSTKTEPKFVSPKKYFDRIEVGNEDYFIAKFNDQGLIDNVGDYSISFREAKNIIDKVAAGNFGEWFELNLDAEDYFVYALKGKTLNSIVGLKKRDFSARIFHNLKIFFIHSLLLILFAILYFSFLLIKRVEFEYTFRAKLFSAFLITALIPIIFLAFYLRDLTENKNKETIKYKLKKRAVRVDDYIGLQPSAEALSFENLDKMEKELGIKFNIYDNKELYYSSFGKYYTTGILNPYINFIPFQEIISGDKKSKLVSNKIGKLRYNSFYYKLNDYLVLEINDTFNQIILPIKTDEFDTILFGSYVLASLMIILLSTILSNQISRPIDKLTAATESLSSGDLEIRIKENYTGEFGKLIKAFNTMAAQLKKNSAELASLEREVAWKEMAKQVAHEIKNPLTPMKLSVQHLKAAYRDKSEKFEEIFEKVTNTIINQIETLGRISSEFSNVAKMPKLNLQKVKLNECILKATDLFTHENIQIEIIGDQKDIFVNADEDQLKRTIINLLRNSIQANSRKVTIKIIDEVNEVSIDISDDGSGIPVENQNKIFEPNFTTKTSGMGLGLSMAKRFMESINGNLYLVNSDSNGTIFRIKLKKSNNG